jgi:3-dehydroquinate dehydratase I
MAHDFAGDPVRWLLCRVCSKLQSPEMVHIGTLQLGGVPRIAVPLSDVEVRYDAAAARPYADLFELRIDHFENRDLSSVCETCHEAATHGLPLLGTVRSAEEGGGIGLTESKRLQLFEAVVPVVDAVDIELGAPIRSDVIALARKHGRPLIISYHNFDHTPADDNLVAMIEAAKEQGADVVKLAVTAQSMDDTDRLLGVLRAHRSIGLILVAMGAHGAMSRVFFPLVGSLLTYGFARSANAPGQVPAQTLFEELSRYSPEFRQEKVGGGVG